MVSFNKKNVNQYITKKHKQLTEIIIAHVVLWYLCAFNYNKCSNYSS